MSTRKSIADQILLRISKGYTDSSSAVQLPDVIIAVGQKLNAMLSQQYMGQTLPSGDTIPSGIMLTPYTGLSVSSFGNRSKCILPAMPVSLPMDMGVYEVSANGNSFIPLMPGQAFLLKGQDCIGNLLGNIGYERSGKDLIFTSDITIQNITSVDVKLVLVDINILSDFDILPIDAAMEDMLINQLVQQFAPSQTNNDSVDNLNTEKTNEANVNR